MARCCDALKIGEQASTHARTHGMWSTPDPLKTAWRWLKGHPKKQFYEVTAILLLLKQ